MHRLRLGYRCFDLLNDRHRESLYAHCDAPTRLPLLHYLLQCPTIVLLRHNLPNAVELESPLASQTATRLVAVTPVSLLLQTTTSQPPPRLSYYTSTLVIKHQLQAGCFITAKTRVRSSMLLTIFSSNGASSFPLKKNSTKVVGNKLTSLHPCFLLPPTAMIILIIKLNKKAEQITAMRRQIIVLMVFHAKVITVWRPSSAAPGAVVLACLSQGTWRGAAGKHTPILTMQ